MTSRCCWLIQPARATRRKLQRVRKRDHRVEPIKAVPWVFLLLRPMIFNGPRQIRSLDPLSGQYAMACAGAGRATALASAGQQRRDRRHLHRSRDLSDSDERRQHHHRSGLRATLRTVRVDRATARASAGRSLRRSASDCLRTLSHNHYDHCDLETLRALQHRDHPRIVTLQGNATLLRSAGVTRIAELDWWQRMPAEMSAMPGAQTLDPVVSPGREIEITATQAQHFSARTPFDRNRASWAAS